MSGHGLEFCLQGAAQRWRGEEEVDLVQSRGHRARSASGADRRFGQSRAPLAVTGAVDDGQEAAAPVAVERRVSSRLARLRHRPEGSRPVPAGSCRAAAQIGHAPHLGEGDVFDEASKGCNLRLGKTAEGLEGATPKCVLRRCSAESESNLTPGSGVTGAAWDLRMSR